MIMAPKCYERRCRHYIGVAQPDGTEESEMNVCRAFPRGIPEDIEDGRDLHRQVRADQTNDIVYEREED